MAPRSVLPGAVFLFPFSQGPESTEDKAAAPPIAMLPVRTMFFQVHCRNGKRGRNFVFARRARMLGVG